MCSCVGVLWCWCVVVLGCCGVVGLLGWGVVLWCCGVVGLLGWGVVVLWCCGVVVLRHWGVGCWGVRWMMWVVQRNVPRKCELVRCQTAGTECFKYACMKDL